MQSGASKSVGRAVSLKVDDRIKALLLVPDNQLATAKARKLLPETISHQDAVLNSSRAALLVHALAQRPDLLFNATEDLLHQSYRESAMPKDNCINAEITWCWFSCSCIRCWSIGNGVICK
jgi:homoserine kinase